MSSEETRESLLKLLRLLDKGIAMERNARDFYARAARIVEDLNARKMFEWLANFEVGHKKRLEAKVKNILADDTLADVDIPQLGEFEVSEAIWKKNFPEHPSDLEILTMAMENEKRAYAFYQRKITFTTDELLLEMLETMARDEDKHFKILEDQYENLQRDHIWGTMEEIEKFVAELDEKDNLIS